MPKSSGNSVADIAKFVARGNSQSPANCRILLREIETLRARVGAQDRNRDQFIIDPSARKRIIDAIALALDGFENDPELIADQVIAAIAAS